MSKHVLRYKLFCKDPFWKENRTLLRLFCFYLLFFLSVQFRFFAVICGKDKKIGSVCICSKRQVGETMRMQRGIHHRKGRGALGSLGKGSHAAFPPREEEGKKHNLNRFILHVMYMMMMMMMMMEEGVFLSGIPLRQTTARPERPHQIPRLERHR